MAVTATRVAGSDIDLGVVTTGAAISSNTAVSFSPLQDELGHRGGAAIIRLSPQGIPEIIAQVSGSSLIELDALGNDSRIVTEYGRLAVINPDLFVVPFLQTDMRNPGAVNYQPGFVSITTTADPSVLHMDANVDVYVAAGQGSTSVPIVAPLGDGTGVVCQTFYDPGTGVAHCRIRQYGGPAAGSVLYQDALEIGDAVGVSGGVIVFCPYMDALRPHRFYFIPAGDYSPNPRPVLGPYPIAALAGNTSPHFFLGTQGDHAVLFIQGLSGQVAVPLFTNGTSGLLGVPNEIPGGLSSTGQVLPDRQFQQAAVRDGYRVFDVGVVEF